MDTILQDAIMYSGGSFNYSHIWILLLEIWSYFLRLTASIFVSLTLNADIFCNIMHERNIQAKRIFLKLASN